MSPVCLLALYTIYTLYTLYMCTSIHINFWCIHSLEQFLFQPHSPKKQPKLKQNFQKRKVVTGKTQFFVIGQFCTCHSICLNIGF